MIPGINIFSRKASKASVNRAGGSGGHYEPFSTKLPRKILDSKEHLDWLKINLNVKIITVQDSKHTKD